MPDDFELDEYNTKRSRINNMHPNDPDKTAIEGYCSECQDYTTDITCWGTCGKCGNDITEGI